MTATDDSTSGKNRTCIEAELHGVMSTNTLIHTRVRTKHNATHAVRTHRHMHIDFLRVVLVRVRDSSIVSTIYGSDK